MIVNNGLYKITFRTNISNTNWIATNGNVASKSNNPPGPTISELEIKIEKLII
jgi:hypothetical protein